MQNGRLRPLPTALALLAAGAAIAGCTSILGDFSVGDVGPADQADATADGMVAPGPPDARAGDAADAGSPDDAADAGSPDTGCTSGGACTPGACQTGFTTCDNGAATCTPNGTEMNGLACDAGAVCDNGACTACAVGTDCTAAGSCQKKSIVCATGVPVCTAAGNVPDGTPCGTDLYCNAGLCQPCTVNAACTPAGKPCNTGKVSCSGGQASCTDTGTAAANGTPCGVNLVCNAGACTACTAGTSCNPNGDKCLVGQTSCSTGVQTCPKTGNSTDGTPCGPNETCKSGVCGCAATFSACGAACVDLQKDAANCGRCGHSCLYGGCSGGKCQAWTLSSYGTNGGPVAADGSYVVLAADTSMQQIPPKGGTALGISPDTFHVRPGVAGGVIAWPGSGASGLHVFTVAEGQTAGVDHGSLPTGYAWMAAALNPSATSAFFVAQTSAAPYHNDLINCPLASTGCGTLATLATPTSAGYQITQLIVGTSAAYWIYTDGPTQVFSVNRLDFATNGVATVNSKYADKLASDGSYLYFTATPAGTIYRLPVGFASNAVPQTVTSGPATPTSIATDGTNVYFGVYSSSGAASVYYAPVAGGNAAILYTSAVTGSSEGPLAVGGGAIYWVDADLTNDVGSLKGIAAP